MAGEDQLLNFIGSCFRSVWAIELLRFLAERPKMAFSGVELIHELRVSNSVVANALVQLEAAGLIADEDGALRFQPVNAELEALALEAVALYERRPDQVRRTIVSRSSPGITAFSDAFKLRKD